MKAQVAIEFLIIVSIILLFITPIWFYSYTLQNNAKTELSISFAKTAAEKITEMANLVHSQGAPAKVKVRIYIPPGLQSAQITGKSVIFQVRVGQGYSDVTSTSNANLMGPPLPTGEGTYTFTIEAVGETVSISAA